MMSNDEQWWAVMSSDKQWWAVMSSDEQWWAVMSSDEQWWAMMSNDEQWWAVMSNDEQWWAVMSSDEQWWAMMSSDEQWWAVISSDEQWWAVMSSDEQLWAVMSNDGQWWAMMSSDEQWWAMMSNDEQLWAVMSNDGQWWAMKTSSVCPLSLQTSSHPPSIPSGLDGVQFWHGKEHLVKRLGIIQDTNLLWAPTIHSPLDGQAQKSLIINYLKGRDPLDAEELPRFCACNQYQSACSIAIARILGLTSRFLGRWSLENGSFIVQKKRLMSQHKWVPSGKLT